jgi:hypothetical protein
MAQAETSTPETGPRKRPPPRPVGEIISDLGRERDGLVEAVDQLKLEAKATRQRYLSPRTAAIAGGALLSLILLRRRRKHH